MGSLQVEFPLVFLRALVDVPLHNNIALQNAHLDGTGPCNFVAWKTEETVSILLGGRDESLQLQATDEGLCCRVTVMAAGKVSSCESAEEEESEESMETSESQVKKEDDDPALKPFICPASTCTQRFETLSEVKDHLDKRNEEHKDLDLLMHAIRQIEEYKDCKQKLLIQCPLCTMKLMPKHVNSHFSEQHKSEPDSQSAMLSCLYIRQQYRTLCKLTLGHLKPDPKECPFCEKIFTTSIAVFHRHMNFWCKKNPNCEVNKCKECDSETYVHHKQPELVAKVRRPSSIFKCPLCEYTASSVEQGVVHLLDEHSAEERANHCELCQRYFISSHALLTHRRIKHAETVTVKAYQCRVCSQSFNTREELDADMDAHAKEGLFICDICSKESTSFDTLRRHIQRIHKAKFPAYCEKCSSGIVNKKAVSMHRCASRFKHLINADEKQLEELKKSEVVCNICQSVFRNLKVLNNHIRTIHEKRFPHHCNKCGAGLKTRAGLLRHRCLAKQSRPKKPKEAKLEEEEEEEVEECIFCAKEIGEMVSYEDHKRYECSENPDRQLCQIKLEDDDCKERNMDLECEEKDGSDEPDVESPANQCKKCQRVLRTSFALKHHSCRKKSA